MPVIPWKSAAAADGRQEYVVMASRLPLRSYWKIPLFLRLTRAVQQQLAGAEGLVGYSLRAQPLRKTFWTLSAWTGQEQLDAFARALPHLDIMRQLRPHMAPTTFRTWTVAGTALPVPWTEATARLMDAQAPGTA